MFSHDENSNVPKHLQLIWRDPLAVLYLTPVPKELELHYGIEITFLKPNRNSSGESLVIDEARDQVVEVVGYDETRFFRHMHNKSVAVGAAGPLESDKNHLNVTGTPNQKRLSIHWQQNMESGSICSYSVLGGGDGSISHLEESFTYRVTKMLVKVLLITCCYSQIKNHYLHLYYLLHYHHYHHFRKNFWTSLSLMEISILSYGQLLMVN